MFAWEKSLPQANKLFEATIGPQNDAFAEYFLKGFSLLQLLAGVLIVINQAKLGAQLLFLAILGFLASTYNPYFIGFEYEPLTLFFNELSLLGVPFLLYGYANNHTEVKECPFAHEAQTGNKKNKKNKKKTD